MLARLFVAFGSLFVLALLAAVAAPQFVDWSQYRGDFERELAAVLGRKVTVNGEAHATLIPFPSVTFTEVVVGGAGSEPAMTVDTFSMDAELAPLLNGEFRIFDMRLERPRATLTLGADGKVDWAIRPSTPFDPRRVSLEKLTVTDGELMVRHDRSGRVHRLTEINGDLSARTLAGPWRASGSLRFDGALASVALTTGSAEADAMRLRLTVEPAGSAIVASAEGDARLEDGVPSWAGTFHLAPASPPQPEQPEGSQPEKGDRVAQPDAESGGFRVTGAFELDGSGVRAPSFRFENGPVADPYTAEGTARLDWGGEPSFAIEASGAQFRFDQAVLGLEEGAEPHAGLTLERRLAALDEALRAIPHPSIPGRISLSLPALVAGDTTVRDLALEARPSAAGWQVDRLAATLPGRATLEASGLFGLEGGLGFEGSLLLAVAQPSGFAAWLARDVNEPIRRLPGAGFSADVTLSANEQRFRNLELDLGGATFRGAAEHRQPEDGRGFLGLELDGGRLELEQLAAFASLFVSEQGQNRWSDLDLRLALRAGPVAGSGLTVGSVQADLDLRGERLEIRKLELTDLAGADITSQGVIDRLHPLPLGRLSARVEAPDLAPLVALAAARFPGIDLLPRIRDRADVFPGLLGNAQIDLTLDRAQEGAANLSVRGRAGGTALNATVSASGNLVRPAATGWSARLEAANPNGEALLALAGLPALPLNVVGAAEARLSLDGSLGEGLIGQASVTGEGFAFALDGVITRSDGSAAAAGTAKLEADDVEPWMMSLGTGLPGFGLGTSARLAAEVDWAADLLVLSGLTGSIGSDAVAGDVNIALGGGKPEITGALSLDALQLDSVALALLGPDALSGNGAAWPETPFTEAPVLPFGAALDLSVEQFGLGPLAFDDAAFAFKLDGARIAVDGFTGALGGGAAEGSVELKNSEGTGLLTVQLGLRGGDLGLLLPAQGLEGRADLSAALSASGKSVAGLVATLSGSGSASVVGLRVPSLNAEALPQLIAAADQVGRDVDAVATARFAPGIAGAGTFTARRVDVPFTVVGGVLRTPPVVIENASAKVTAEINLNANTGNVAVEGSIAYAAGEEALVGSEPRIEFRREGSLAAGRLSFGTEPLAQFLSQRALEREQARVEAMQSDLLEKQRLRREARYFAALADQRSQAAEEERQREAERRRLEEAARQAEEERLRQEAAQRQTPPPPSPPPVAPAPKTPPAARDGIGLGSLPGVSIEGIPSQPSF